MQLGRGDHSRGSTDTQSTVMVCGSVQSASPAQGIWRGPKIMRAGRSGSAGIVQRGLCLGGSRKASAAKGQRSQMTQMAHTVFIQKKAVRDSP
jgi:hypothetical protein